MTDGSVTDYKVLCDLLDDRDCLAVEVERLTRERDDERACAQESARMYRSARDRAEAAERELERWHHDVPVEGDYVCPHELRAANAERDTAEKIAAWLDARYDVLDLGSNAYAVVCRLAAADIRAGKWRDGKDKQ